MESCQAMRMLIGSDVVTMAKRLHRSTSLIHTWAEPHTDYEQSGAMNPLDRLEIMIEFARGAGRTDDEALAAEQARQLRAATREQVKAHNKLVRDQALRRSRSTNLTDRATPDCVAISPSADTPPSAEGDFSRGVFP